MSLMNYLSACCLALSLTSTAFASPGEHKAPPMPKDFSHLKALVGQWEGTNNMNGKETPMTVTYKLISGGTVVEERIFEGTPHEMVTLYYADGKKMAASHFCAVGNHPKMNLKNANDSSLAFEMKGHDGIRSPKEGHMHALTLSWADTDHLKQEWTYFENGKKKETTTFNFTRKK